MLDPRLQCGEEGIYEHSENMSTSVPMTHVCEYCDEARSRQGRAPVETNDALVPVAELPQLRRLMASRYRRGLTSALSYPD
jgi:hypothetical protein